jgi:hypothetical protein
VWREKASEGGGGVRVRGRGGRGDPGERVVRVQDLELSFRV